MREEFTPPQTADLLWKHILARTQGKYESIGEYVALMNCLFDRMPTEVSDTSQLQVLRKKILAFY